MDQWLKQQPLRKMITNSKSKIQVSNNQVTNSGFYIIIIYVVFDLTFAGGTPTLQIFTRWYNENKG